MESDDPGCEYAYGWNRLNMLAIGAWPEENQNFMLKNCGFFYAFLVFIIIWVPMTWSLLYLSGDLNELILCLVVNVPVAISIYKLALFRIRREVIAAFLAAMVKDWATKRTEVELNVMLEKAKYGRFISIMSVSLATGVLVTFTSFGAWSAHVERPLITNETRLAIGMLYPAYFPYDTKTFRGYLPTFLGQCFGTVVAMIGYSGPDSLVAMMILHLCGQLATVRIALANIVDEESIKDPSIYWARLSSIIKRHEELNRFSNFQQYGELLEGSFNVMLLMQMIFCTLTFCFQGFVTTTALIGGLTDDGDVAYLQLSFFIVHGFYTTLHLFMYCWAGDLLATESYALSHAPYESNWFYLPPHQARALMMVTHRSRNPLQMTAGKFVGFSLELFTSIMKTSMGYLSVLLAMQDD